MHDSGCVNIHSFTQRKWNFGAQCLTTSGKRLTKSSTTALLLLQ